MLIPNAPAVSDMSEGIAVVPEATYSLKVHKAEYVAIPKGKDAKGPYIKAQLVITGPAESEQYVGRFVFQNYSLTGDGNFRLRDLLKATGHPDDFQLTDSDQLLGLEFSGAVIIQKAKEGSGYSDKNEVRKHLPLINA